MKKATLALVLRGNKVLLGRKKNSKMGNGKYNGPGGGVEEGESLLECLVRETFEEFGIMLEPTQLVKVAIITFYAGGAPNQEVHVYRTTVFGGEPRETASMAPPFWHDVNQLPFGEMHEADQKWMPRALFGKKFCANVFYEKPGEGFQYLELREFVESA